METEIFPKEDGSSYKILVAEDNDINRIMAVSLFESLGFCEAEIAKNGEDAVKKFKSKKYDMIFMDCDMPMLNGYEATAAIRDIERTEKRKRTPIVALTAKVYVEDRERCLSSGMDDYIPKPIRKDAVSIVINRFCAPIVDYTNQW